MEEELEVSAPEVIKFSDKAREANRQYEFNYNEEVDNGVMISQSDENPAENKQSKRSDSPRQVRKPKKIKLDPLESSDSNDE